MVQDIVHDELFFLDDTISCENKTSNHEIKEMFIADPGSMSHMVKSLKNMMNLREVKTLVKTGNKKIMTGLL